MSSSRFDQLPIDKSVGAVLISPRGKILIVKGINGKWGFPKGHIEGAEVELQTMQREVKEETGITVEGFVLDRVEESFILHHSAWRINIYLSAGKDPYYWEPCYVNRVNVYFIIRTSAEYEFTLQKDEITDACWANIDRARQIFTENRSCYIGVLNKAAKHIRKIKKKRIRI